MRLRARGQQDRRPRQLAADQGERRRERKRAASRSIETGSHQRQDRPHDGGDRARRRRLAFEPAERQSRSQSRSKPRKTTARAANQGAARKKNLQAGAAKIPPFVAPQLATLVDAPPHGRRLAARNQVRRLSRDHVDRAATASSSAPATGSTGPTNSARWSSRSPNLPCESRAARRRDRGRGCAKAIPISARLQDAHVRRDAGGFGYYVFDLLHLDGEDLRSLPLSERKAKLAKAAGACRQAGRCFIPIMSTGSGDEVFAKPASSSSKASSRNARMRPIAPAAAKAG